MLKEIHDTAVYFHFESLLNRVKVNIKMRSFYLQVMSVFITVFFSFNFEMKQYASVSSRPVE